MRLVFSAVSGVLMSALLTSSAAGQESLAWKFEEGQALRYEVRQGTLMDISVAGQKQQMKSSQIMDMVWTIQSVDSAGVAKMSQVVERIQMESTGGPLGSLKYDSSSTDTLDARQQAIADTYRKIVGQQFIVTMRPTGKIDNVEVPQSLVDALTKGGASEGLLTEKSLKEMMAQSAVTLPAQPVNPAESWENSQSVDFMIGTMIVNSVLTYDGTNNGIAMLTTRPKIDVKPKDGAPLTLKLSKSEGEGTVQFDVNAGHISRSDLELTLDMQVTRLGTTVDMTMRQSTNMVLAQ